MKTINKTILGLIALYMIFLTFVLFSFLSDHSDEKFMQDLSLHQMIDEKQIESIKMSKVILINSTYKHADVYLTNEQKQKIIYIFNSIPRESINSIKPINPSISLGIVIRLKNGSEIRIQYDKKNILVTRSEVIYTVEDIKLKELFDRELKDNNI